MVRLCGDVKACIGYRPQVVVPQRHLACGRRCKRQLHRRAEQRLALMCPCASLQPPRQHGRGELSALGLAASPTGARWQNATGNVLLHCWTDNRRLHALSAQFPARVKAAGPLRMHASCRRLRRPPLQLRNAPLHLGTAPGYCTWVLHLGTAPCSPAPDRVRHSFPRPAARLLRGSVTASAVDPSCLARTAVA